MIVERLVKFCLRSKCWFYVLSDEILPTFEVLISCHVLSAKIKFWNKDYVLSDCPSL